MVPKPRLFLESPENPKNIPPAFPEGMSLTPLRLGFQRFLTFAELVEALW
jgi:hypothetical protein